MKKTYFLIFVSVLFILISSSCTRNLRYIYKPDENIDSVYVYKNSSKKYHLQVDDVLNIKISTTNQEINEIFKIDGQGNNNNMSTSGNNMMLSGYVIDEFGFIEIPVLGKFQMLGKTMTEARQILQEKLDKLLTDAILKVNLVSFKISFLGEVGSSGVVYISQENIDILEALSLVGGVTDYGNKRRVKVIRPVKEGNIVFNVDITKRSLLESEKFYLYPNDKIVVNPRPIKLIQTNLRDFTFFLSILSSIVTTGLLIYRK